MGSKFPDVIYWISIIFVLSYCYQVSAECCRPISILGTPTCLDGTILSIWGGCCGKGPCSINCCNCDNGCREKPTDSHRVVSAQVYGGHKVFLGWHHVFIVLEDNYGKFHMLEVSPTCKEQQPIKIRHGTADSISGAVGLRWESDKGYEAWGSRLNVNEPFSSINRLISQYEDYNYILGFRNCRSFVYDILAMLGHENHAQTLGLRS